MKKRLKVFSTCSSSAGFTLIELLIAMSLTVVVIGLTGFGLVAIMEKSSKIEAETLRRIELNRALDFMADEVRTAKAITKNVYIDVQTTVAPDFPSECNIPTDGVDCALILELPGVSQPVIYYVASPQSTSPWLGPRVIYRWGPNFDNKGQYSNPSSPKDWKTAELVDRIEDSVPNPNPNCATGWFPNPPVDDRDGFYACVDSTGRIAEIYLRGKLINAYGNSLTPYQVNTKVFARSGVTP